MSVELYDHQKTIVERNPERYVLALSTGLGKTITLLALAQKNNVKCLIIVPKALKQQWQEYNESWDGGHTIMTKEEAVKAIQKKAMPAYAGVIIDEVHLCLGFKSKRFKALDRYINGNNIKYRWFASATPLTSDLMSLYSLLKLLGYNPNYWTFVNRFFVKFDMGGKTVTKPKAGMQDEVKKIINSIGTTLNLNEIVEVPEQTDILEMIELTPEQKEAIKHIKKTEPEHIVRFTKTHCIEQGLLYGDEYTEDQEFPSNKTKRIIELVEEHGKVAIFCRYTKQLHYLKKAIEEAIPVKSGHIYIIDGQNKDRHGTVQAVNADEEAVVLIQGSCSSGFELPTIGYVIFASLSFSYIDYIQAKGRFLRINKLKENTYYYLVTEGVDKHVYKSIINKQDFHEHVFASKMKDE